MFYGSNHTLREPLYDLFAERFPGINVQSTELVGAQLQATLEAESSTGKHAGTILDNANGARYAGQGYAEPYMPLAFQMPTGLTSNLESHTASEDGSFVVAQWSLFGVGINTDLIDASELPTNWADFADPKWEGKLVMHDPSAPGGGQGFLSRLYLSGAVDEETLEGIAANVALKGEFAQTVQSLTQGEYPVMLGADAPYMALNASRGQPLEVHFMAENNIAMAMQSMILDGTTSPNLARIWQNWIFSSEAQEQMAEAGNTPITDVASPHGLPTFSEANLADIPPQDELDANADMIQETFSSIFAAR
ncbi:MAG: ABC transporter substrate-binding protein [Pseudoclavibacter sp.]